MATSADYYLLCSLLAGRRVQDHPQFASWSIAHGRRQVSPPNSTLSQTSALHPIPFLHPPPYSNHPPSTLFQTGTQPFQTPGLGRHYPLGLCQPARCASGRLTCTLPRVTNRYFPCTELRAPGGENNGTAYCCSISGTTHDPAQERLPDLPWVRRCSRCPAGALNRISSSRRLAGGKKIK